MIATLWIFLALAALARADENGDRDVIRKTWAPSAIAAGLGNIGWHTFRHSYRSWLDDTGAPLTVQKELMRHASIQTTMNIYGKAMTDTKRQAHSKVVEMVFKSSKTEKTVDPKKPVAGIGINGSLWSAQKSA